jgi:ATP-dependent RNA helicase RhlB
MDFQRFGIDERFSAASEGLRSRAVFHEKMLTHAHQKHENVCARIALSEGREEVLLLPALQWLLGQGAEARVLAVAPDGRRAERLRETATALGALVDLNAALVWIACPTTGAESAGAEALFSGDAAARIMVGQPEALLAASEAGFLRLRDYGFLVVDGVDVLAEMPSEFLRRFGGSLRPSWERRTILACSRIGAKTKNLAWDLADNPSEIRIEEEVVKAQEVRRETWHITSEDKLRFLLGLVERERPSRLCVFCNLTGTAEEVAKRLEVNGLSADYVSGSLPVDRKLAILEKTKRGPGAVFVLTDQGAEGLPPGNFSLLVNYDIPLEPEFYVKRLDMLARGDTLSKVVNLACDRYVYGLPAVEQYIDMKLDAASVDPSLLTIQDKSAGMVFDGPRRSAPDARDARREPPRREDRKRNESRRDDRSPDIRKSISDATGGSLDMESVGELPGRARQRGSLPKREENKAAGQRKEGRRREGEKKSGTRRAGETPSKLVNSGNPYALPMEERMRRYREMYGRRLGGERSDEARGAAPRQGGRRREGKRQEGSRTSPDPRPEIKGERRPERARREEQRTIPRDASPEPKSTDENDAARQGMLGRLLGIFRRKIE